jgi:hypothetical protein
MELDLARILEDWDYVPNQITTRKIQGLDGREKVQMRLDLGLLQMELDGRPDGKRPHGCESLFEYHQERLKKHLEGHGEDVGFHLNVEDCEELRAESSQYYHRYLSLFHLGDYERVVRDTKRNLSVLDFVKEYGSKDWDRMALEQYRPYIKMMNARARACILLAENRHQEALDVVVDTIEQIRDFFEAIGQKSLFEQCNEVVYLRSLADEIVKKLPRDPVEDLRHEMNMAVQQEEYERAADLRDRIRKLKASRE